MKNNKIEQIVKSYYYGNIADTKAALKKLSKREIVDFIDVLAIYDGASNAILETKRLL